MKVLQTFIVLFVLAIGYGLGRFHGAIIWLKKTNNSIVDNNHESLVTPTKAPSKTVPTANSNHDSTISKLDFCWQQHDYVCFFQLLNLLPEQQQSPWVPKILAKVDTLESHSSAQSYVNTYLNNIENYQVSILLAFSNYFTSDNNWYGALELIDLARQSHNNLTNPTLETALDDQVIDTLLEADDQLSQQEWIDLLMYANDLFNHLGLINLYLAAEYMQLEQMADAEFTLTQVSPSDPIYPKAQKLLAQIQQSQAAPNTINLTPMGQQYLVDIKVDGIAFTLLIDTGASITSLAPQALSRLGIDQQDSIKNITFNTANGQAESYLFKINSLSIGTVMVNNVTLASLPVEINDNADGLLGMDILSQYHFQIDQQNNQLILTDRSH
ncbi:TIGR02281 family clan AA aspartic protease [Paraferrimonas sp. SM1919]|uniref:retropepsin-like aspartic protease family protein n=1 Tax=Paraferrimonas sp. SM1919 TaxID=2662263 RepID=UPI0013D28AE5|nr:retropepsin-like aspartic protease [Paraferrimonas sp. SM1919]